MEKFKRDLLLSQESVDKVKEYLIEIGATEISENNDSKYDLSYYLNGMKTAEVKNDLQYHLTGNVALEYLSRNKPSGICSSKADEWFYVLGDEIYHTPLSNLRYKIIKNMRTNFSNDFRMVDGGDDNTSELILVKIDAFKKIFKKVK